MEINNQLKLAKSLLESKGYLLDDLLIFTDRRFRLIGKLDLCKATRVGDWYCLNDITVIEDRQPHLISYVSSSEIMLTNTRIKENLSRPTEYDLNFKKISEIN